MKYIRTKKGIENVENLFLVDYYDANGNAYKLNSDGMTATKIDYEKLLPNNKVADTIEELIQVGDIVFYWVQSDDTERCEVIVREDDIRRVRFNTLTKLLIPVGENYICVAKQNNVFVTISNRRYLQMKGELELLWKSK